VTHIEISGNKRTREYVVLRELDFAVGDTISQQNLALRLERNRANLLNTAIFTDVELNIKEWHHDTQEIVISVVVKEAWYLYIVPIIELADRNFNVWWQEHNRAFNRLNLGILANHINFTGVRDRLKVKGQVGYTPKFEVNYALPYFNRAKTLGLMGSALWSSNREVAYLNEGNKQVFYKDDNASVFRRLRLQAGLVYRPNIYIVHELEASFYNSHVDPQIAQDNNPDFFLFQKSRQTFFGLRYKGVFDNRDLQLFPMKGFLGGIEVIKEGIGAFKDMNSLRVYPFIEYHQPITRNITIGAQCKAQYGLIREKQPFWNYQGLGYGRDYVRGYELYVINGLDYIYGKINIKARAISGQIDWKRKLPRAFREMPYQFYVTLNYDIGHVNDPFYNDGNPLVNQTIKGGGPGLGLVLYHTFAMHVEYSFNQLGENGLFLHTKTSF
jgi:outer membrane protein assembly factor BamA